MTSEAQPLRIRPRETRGDRTRARLVEAGLEEFRRHGFERASIARIARAAGVSRPSFYFHFPKKEDLLREVLGAFEEQVVERISHARGLPEALERLVEAVLGIRDEVGGAVFAEMLRAQTRAGLHQDDPSTPVRDAIEPLFREAAATGRLRMGLDPERAAWIYLSSMFGCLLEADRAGHPEDLRALTSLFLREAPEGGPS